MPEIALADSEEEEDDVEAYDFFDEPSTEEDFEAVMTEVQDLPESPHSEINNEPKDEQLLTIGAFKLLTLRGPKKAWKPASMSELLNFVFMQKSTFLDLQTAIKDKFKTFAEYGFTVQPCPAVINDNDADDLIDVSAENEALEISPEDFESSFEEDLSSFICKMYANPSLPRNQIQIIIENTEDPLHQTVTRLLNDVKKLKLTAENLPQGVGYRVGGGSIGHLAFADDVTLFASTPEGLSEALGAFRRALGSVGLDVNPGKCRTLAFDVETWDSEKHGTIPKDTLIQLIRGKAGLLVTTCDLVDQEVIASGAPSLQVVSTMSVGVNHVDLKALKEFNVRLGYNSDINVEATAELTVALLLATSRRIVEASAAVKSDRWTTNRGSFRWLCGQGLHDSTVGIIGYGKIGHSVAMKLKSFSPRRIFYTSRKEKPNGNAIGAVYTDLDTLLKSCDFVVLTLALTPETTGIISRSKIALMKENAVFINTGRGALVDQDALVAALQQRKILGAGLDVMSPEPLPQDHPLQKLDNCVLLPHIGSDTAKSIDDACLRAAENIVAALKGTPMPAEYPL
nr:PREDICTED: glyoxylate reductase/hydroxypyruvate reductase-like [Bemisia tabaci]